MFRYLVLGLLRDGEARHGYALMKQYRDRSGLQLNTGNFYRELARLVAEGLIQTVANPTEADPRRAPYQITTSGSACFDAWLAGPTGTGVGRYEDELSARAMFLADAEPAVVMKLLDGWKEDLWLKSKVDERTRRSVMSDRVENGVFPRSFPALPLLLARNIKHVTADIEFLQELSTAYRQWIEKRRVVDESRPRRGSAVTSRRRTPADEREPR
jgi:DNA-binding PadR family transcriptional regulator